MSWWGQKGRKLAAVFGCGPAGLFAVHGLKAAGWDVTIFSKRGKSHMYGAQYLHAPIEGLSPSGEVPEEIHYKLNGDVGGYRDKVYGSTPVKVSPQMLENRHMSWDIRAAYDNAWELYGGQVLDLEVTPAALGIGSPDAPAQPIMDWQEFDLIINTIPLNRICYQPDSHLFHSTQIWALGDAPDRGQFAPYRPERNTVKCDGTTGVGWYRAANIRGHVTVEWPGNRKPPLPAVSPVTKPLYTDCTCYRDGTFPVKFAPMGRYGAWSKRVLSHHVYTQAAQL